MQINLLELWANMGLPVRGVVVLLTLQAVACVAVVIDRFLVLATSASRAREFAAAVQGAMEAGDYEKVLSSAGSTKPSHLTGYLEIGIRTFLSRRELGDGVERAAELARRVSSDRRCGPGLHANRGRRSQHPRRRAGARDREGAVAGHDPVRRPDAEAQRARVPRGVP